MKSIVFRADGAKKMGMGHLNRCYLIASYLKSYYGIPSILITKKDSASRLFLSSKASIFKVIYIDKSRIIKHELKVFSDLEKNGELLLILMDLLEIETEIGNEYLNSLRKLDIPVCVISDDSNYHEFSADLIINGNPNQVGNDYLSALGKYLIGPKYFIMDPDYANLSEHCQTENRIIVSLGGSDHNNIIFPTLNSLVKISNVQEIVVISSKSTGYADKLSLFSLNCSNKKIKLYFDVESLSAYWNSCSMAITAGGNTLFERIASGIPGATICQLSRQMEIADAFEKLGVNINLGYGPILNANKLDVLISEFFENKEGHDKQRALSKRVVAGEGLKYCTKEMLKLL